MAIVLERSSLGFMWPTIDPFLFCVHHHDAYPVGTAQFGPHSALLSGREIGQDFSGREGFSMYHGEVVPGFPPHPHRGFETVTIVRRGFIDHSDSLGAAARFGNGDVQWLTAGAGIVHSEMFPLLSRQSPNPVELFQIWLNLPARSKMVPPHFSMYWNHNIAVQSVTDSFGRSSEVTVIAGHFGEQRAQPPPPNSWASQVDSDVAILTIRMQPGATLLLPKASGPKTRRMLYFFVGDDLQLQAGDLIDSARVREAQGEALLLDASQSVTLVNGARSAELLLLQGREIGEPVVQHGPFVMNSKAEIMQAMADYRRTEFGGWPWPSNEPVHGSEPKRFARYPDGRTEVP